MKELVVQFAKLGFLGFGGPIAIIGLMEEEFCAKRKWVTPTRFAEMYSLCKILPGPQATLMAIYLGSLRLGKWGGLVSGILFILPSFLIVLVLSFLYASADPSRSYSQFFNGFQAGALAVILLSTLKLARPHVKNRVAWIVSSISGAVIFKWPRSEPWVILLAGLSMVFLMSRPRTTRPTQGPGTLNFTLFSGYAFASKLHLGFMGAKLAQLGWVCFKAGAFIFGSGLAIIPLLEADVVRRFHWLTPAQFMDGLAIGQVTPGPVVIACTFIGYSTAGLSGALVATAGVFLPAFIYILVIVPKVWEPWARNPSFKDLTSRFTSGAIPAVIGGIFGTFFKLGRWTLLSPTPIALFSMALLLGLRTRAPGWLLILGAGFLGVLSQCFRVSF